MTAPILLPHQAETDSLKLKWVMHRGSWVKAEYLLTRGADGRLSDKPATGNDTREEAA